MGLSILKRSVAGPLQRFRDSLRRSAGHALFVSELADQCQLTARAYREKRPKRPRESQKLRETVEY